MSTFIRKTRTKTVRPSEHQDEEDLLCGDPDKERREETERVLTLVEETLSTP